MNTRKKLVSVISGAAMIATAFGAPASLVPASAAPGQSGATLFITQDQVTPTNYLLAVLGTFRMPEADAVGFLNNINNGRCEGGMFYHIIGDDGDPQYIVTKRFLGAHEDDQGYFKATSEGLVYRRQILLRKNFLNEDSDGEDEIYAQASFLDSDCKTRVQTTQVITNHF